MRTHALAAAVAVAALAFTACSSADDQTAAANDEVCSSIDGLAQSASTAIDTASEAADGDASITIEQAQEGAKTLQRQWGDLKKSLQELDSAVNWQVTAAMDQFQDTVSQISKNDELTGAEALQELSTAKGTLTSELNDIGEQIGC